MSILKGCIPNILTSFRIAGAFLLLFLTPMSMEFLGVYLLCGVSDMIDGWVARKLHVESRFGASFDGFADLVFILVCLVIFIPYFLLPIWLWIFAAVIFGMKLLSLCLRYKKEGVIGFSSSRMNKFAGALLFISPVAACFVGIIPPLVIAGLVCLVSAFLELKSFR